MPRAFPLLALLALTLACTSAPETPASDPRGEPFGAAVSDARPVDLPTLMASAPQRDGEVVVLDAVVDDVCPKKGCWMTFDSGAGELRVTFKDYAFFVPKDIAGRRVLVEGVFEEVEVPLAEARHYLEDAGRHDEAAALSGPQKGWRLVATGVVLRPADG